MRGAAYVGARFHLQSAAMSILEAISYDLRPNWTMCPRTNGTKAVAEESQRALMFAS